MSKYPAAIDLKRRAAVPGRSERTAAGPAAGGGFSGAPAIESLIREGARLKSEIEGKTARLRQINLALAEGADFAGAQRTAHLTGAGYHVTVRLHDNVSWDQERVGAFREVLPGEKFEQLFRMVYEPTSKKQIDGFMDHADPELAAGLRACMSIRPGAPQVSYEKD